LCPILKCRLQRIPLAKLMLKAVYQNTLYIPLPAVTESGIPLIYSRHELRA